MAKRVLLLEHPGWWGRAACAGIGPDVFFDPDPGAEQAAKAICARCEVAAACRAWAFRQHLTDGVFGGLTPSERRSQLVGSRRAS